MRNFMLKLENVKIAVVGLGYVGLPLAVEFSKKFPTIGFDINQKRVNDLKSGLDVTGELSFRELNENDNLSLSSNTEDLAKFNVFVVTVPTPVDNFKKPDLGPLLNVSRMLGDIIKINDLVIYESTVYPGVTEDYCIPEIEKVSGFLLNKNFYAGYSPERINPGDKVNKLKNILKVTSGSTLEVADHVDKIYQAVITAGTYKAPSIRVAEASKVIENIQRDVNIALINEFLQIFNNIGIDTNEVIKAAATKWNFMNLKPGLVGGHCISVDPYYLMHKSQDAGYVPDLIRSAREINASMPEYLVNNFINKLISKKINPIDLDIALIGFSFKEDCPDIRNTKVYDVFQLLIKSGFNVTVYDPVVVVDEVFIEYGVVVESDISNITEEVVFLAVGHSEILRNINFEKFKLVYDFKKVAN
jgi:UDP-N-acetyl-D-glucosamine/UDP-N-acetyl-D-galactosamine dehydrogenase